VIVLNILMGFGELWHADKRLLILVHVVHIGNVYVG